MWLRFARLWVAHGDRRRGQGVMHFLSRYKTFALPYADDSGRGVVAAAAAGLGARAPRPAGR